LSSSSAAAGEGLVLRHGKGYMPSDRAVLQQSEFMEPLSPGVLQLCRGALQDCRAKA